MMTYSKRKLQRSKVKDLDKPFNLSTHEKFSRCKLPLLKLVLLFAISGTFITLLYSPEVNNHISNTASGYALPLSPVNSVSFYIQKRPTLFICRPKFVNRWIWGGPDLRYVSHLDIVWEDVVEVLERLGDKKEYQGIGLLNFNKSEVINWKQLNTDAEHTLLHLEYAEEDVTWDSLYPEWIDEEEEAEVPICPSLPKLRAPGKRLDLIAVKLPCRNEGNWSRDVARLHLQLAAASVAASAKGNYPVHLLFITNCFPIPNLFTCKDLVARRGNVWLYRPNLNVIREKIQLPVGSCELALPLKGKGQSYDRTLLHNHDR